MKKNLKIQSGFTLIELLVSLALFTIVMLAMVSSLFFANKERQKTESYRAIMDNLDFALENMSRSIRLGTNYVCAGSIPITSPAADCVAGSNHIAFKAIDENKVETDTGFGLGSTSTKQIFKYVNGSTIPITDPAISIDELTFYVNGAEPADNRQPSVFIVVSGTASVGGEDSKFTVQTVASERRVE